MPSGRVTGALLSHRFLMRAALAAASSFAWIFALQFFYGQSGSVVNAVTQVTLLYALTQILSLLFTPYAARAVESGVRRSMVWGVGMLVVAFATLGATISGYFGAHAPVGIIAFALLMGIYRACYWVPFALNATYSPRSAVVQEIFIALMPAVAGYSLVEGQVGAASFLFACATVLIASVIPLTRVPETHEKFSWGYGQTFAELFEHKHETLVRQAFLDGIQGAALLLLWPIAIFILVGASYKLFGLVLTITLLLAIPMRGLGRELVEGRRLLHTALAASSWLVRMAVATPFGVIVVDAYSSASSRPGMPHDIYTLEQSADNTTYIDEYTALKEVALAMGRVLMCVVVALSMAAFSLAAGFTVAFVLAACAAGYSAWTHKRPVGL